MNSILKNTSPVLLIPAYGYGIISLFIPLVDELPASQIIIYGIFALLNFLVVFFFKYKLRKYLVAGLIISLLVLSYQIFIENDYKLF